MKKSATISLFALTILLGCANHSQSHYSRIGAVTAVGELAERYTIDSAANQADLIAVVNIEKWLGEDPNEGFGATYFAATIQEILAGKEESRSVTIKQTGSSEMTIKDYPLFGIGNQLMLFLKHIPESKYENAYWILGANTTIFDIVNYEGELYAIDRTGNYSEKLMDKLPPIDDHQTIVRVLEAFKQSDEVWNWIKPENTELFTIYKFEGIKAYLGGK